MTDEARPTYTQKMAASNWLMGQRFPPVEYIVPDLIPEGLTLLAAAPKLGKSWMVLGLAGAAAHGGYAFGHLKVDPRPVLYLALEDGYRRLQARMHSINAKPSHNLFFMIETLPGAIFETIEEFMRDRSDKHPLVILDTLGKVNAPAMANETHYQRDYRVAGRLKQLADSVPGGSILVVHHTRKQDGTDFVDGISGTQGLAGAADTIMVLNRERGTANAILKVTSREAAEGEYSLTLNPNGEWALNGTTLTESAATVHTSELTAGRSDRMLELVAEVNKHPEGIKPKDLALLLHEEDAKVRVYLRRATEVGLVCNPSRGLYAPVTSVAPVTLPLASLQNQGPGQSAERNTEVTSVTSTELLQETEPERNTSNTSVTKPTKTEPPENQRSKPLNNGSNKSNTPLAEAV